MGRCNAENTYWKHRCELEEGHDGAHVATVGADTVVGWPASAVVASSGSLHDPAPTDREPGEAG